MKVKMTARGEYSNDGMHSIVCRTGEVLGESTPDWAKEHFVKIGKAEVLEKAVNREIKPEVVKPAIVEEKTVIEPEVKPEVAPEQPKKKRGRKKKTAE